MMSLENEVIFILGIAKFDGPYESTSFTIAKFLAQKNDVYYIDYPYTLKDYFSGKDAAFQIRKNSFSRSSDGIIETAIARLKILIVPPLLSINFLPESSFYRLLLKINEKTIYNRVRQCIKSKNITDYIFINSFNFHYPNVGSLLKPKLLAYHCVDPLIVEHDRKHGVVSEAIIVKRSDLVICTSKQLYTEKLPQNPNTYFIPNAADITHTSKALNDNLKVHPSLANIKQPIAGYFGNIERRMDYVLLAEVIRSNPEINFVFAGPVDEGYLPKDFRLPDNVHFVGRVPYEEMPAMIKGFDVALIPFKKDEVSHTIFPLKLFEYLGAGKPVVATDFNTDLREFTGETVQFCANAETFSAEIKVALSKNTRADVETRLSIAADNTWEKRGNEIADLLARFLKNKLNR